MVFASAAPEAFAQLQSQTLQDFEAATVLPSTPLPIIIARIIRAIFGVLGIVLTCLVIYAGFLYMTAGGDPAKTTKAKDIIKNAIIGLIIALSAFAITQFVLNRLLAAAGLLGTIRGTAVERYSEPLAAALNGRVIRDHYPPRDAVDIPRNTKIMVTFAEPIHPADVIAVRDEEEGETPQGTLNADRVKIYPAAEGSNAALDSDDVRVFLSADGQTAVFAPVGLLGNASAPMNYTVSLRPTIRTADGPGLLTQEYAWTFEVSTFVDLTPPKVVSVLPRANAEHAPNVTVEITFNEAMDPVAASGVFTDAGFTNIRVLDGETTVPGTYEISNGYRTVSLTTDDQCAQDMCGNIVYCLPRDTNLTVLARAASLDGEGPQARIVGGGYDGLVDAAGNSLDGNGDDVADGPDTDNYDWTFRTSNAIDTRSPALISLEPEILGEFANTTAPVELTFNMPMKTSSLSNANVQLWPDPYYAFWFVTRSDLMEATPLLTERTKVSVNHAMMISSEEGGYDYYPLVTDGVRGNNQFCYMPAAGPGTGSDGTCAVTESAPYCCNGQPSTTACTAGGTPSRPLPPTP